MARQEKWFSFGLHHCCSPSGNQMTQFEVKCCLCTFHCRWPGIWSLERRLGKRLEKKKTMLGRSHVLPGDISFQQNVEVTLGLRRQASGQIWCSDSHTSTETNVAKCSHGAVLHTKLSCCEYISSRQLKKTKLSKQYPLNHCWIAVYRTERNKAEKTLTLKNFFFCFRCSDQCEQLWRIHHRSHLIREQWHCEKCTRLLAIVSEIQESLCWCVVLGEK